MELDLELSEVYEPIYDLDTPGSQKVLLYSPRTSAKSTNLGLLIFLYYDQYRDYDVGVGIDSVTNAGDGVLAEFQSFVEAQGLNKDNSWVFGKQEIYKRGRRNVIKTYAVQTNKLNDVNRTKSKKLIRPISLFVMDEVQKLHSKKILDNCLSTFLRQMKSGHRKIILAGNPDRNAMWFHEYYKQKLKDLNWIVLKPTYNDILEWIPQDLLDEIEAMKRDDPVSYAQIYEGDLDVQGWENVFHSFLEGKHYITRDELAEIDKRLGVGALIQSIVIGIDDAERKDAIAASACTVHLNGLIRAQESFYISCKEMPQKPALTKRCEMIIKYLDFINEHFNYDHELPVILSIDCASGMYEQLMVYKKTDMNYLRWRNVVIFAYTKKNDKVKQLGEINSAFANGTIVVVNVDNYSPQYSNKIAVEQLKALRVLDNGDIDPTIPNDWTDAFQYGVMAVLRNPYNLTFPKRLKEYKRDNRPNTVMEKIANQDKYGRY